MAEQRILELAEIREQDRKQRFAALRDHPVWAELHEHYHQKRESELASYGERALRGALSEREAAELDGYWRGVMAVMNGRDIEPPRRLKGSERA